MKSVGSATSTTRTADQTLAARYWAENPPATWSRIFRTLSAQQGLSLVDNARLFAMLYMTAADALITRLERQGALPVLAADHGDPRGRHRRQPATTKADPDWLPLIPTPPYTGAPVRAHRPQRLVRCDAAGLLRHRPDRLDGHEQRRPDPELHALLGRDRRDRRSSGLVGDPLPQRRRAGREDRRKSRSGATIITSSRFTAVITATTATTATTTDPPSRREPGCRAPVSASGVVPTNGR